MAFNVSYVFQAVDQFTGVADKIAQAMRKVEEGALQVVNRTDLMKERMQDLQDTTARLSGELLATAGTLFAMSLPIKKAIEFEEAMADVRKVVDFDTPDQFRQMGIDIQNMSKVIPMSQKGLASIVAAAGQFGIKRQDLAAFTETAAKMGIAFDISAQEAGQSMAVLSNIFGLTIPQVGELGDAINYLSNSVAATAPDMIKVIQRIGTIAKGFGLAKEQTAALSASILQLGIEPERASTALISLLNTLQLINVGTKQQQDAFSALGINMQEFTKLMRTDAPAALLKVSKAYSTMDPNQIAIINKTLFGEGLEASNIRALLSSGDKMQEVFAMVANKGNVAGSMQKEFAVRSETTSNQLQLLSNRLTNVSINIGSALLPALNSIVSVIGYVVDFIADLSAAFPFLSKVIYGGVFALIAFRLISIASALIMAQLKIAVIGFQLAMASLPSILVGVRGAMTLLNLAFAANPIGIMIAAVAALSAGIIYLLDKFGLLDGMLQTIKEKSLAVASSLKQIFSLDNIKNKITGLFSFEASELPPLPTVPPMPSTINPLIDSNLNLGAQTIRTESQSTVDINLKGNTQSIENIRSKTDGKTNLAISQNMAYGGY